MFKKPVQISAYVIDIIPRSRAELDAIGEEAVRKMKLRVSIKKKHFFCGKIYRDDNYIKSNS